MSEGTPERRKLQAEAWERGMTDCKLQQYGIKQAKNPYLEDEES